MTAIAVQTNIRVSQTVLCNSYRNPALLAKMASTLDVITNGRFELGIGAGWFEREYHAYSYEFPSASIRIEQLKEALQIIKQLWTQSETTFRGKYYTLKNCINHPKPIQKPHPPIMVGGGGDKVLKVAVELADEINIMTSLEKGIEDVNERIQFIYNYCDEIGRDSNEIKLSIFPRVVIGTNEAELDSLIKRFQPKNMSREDFLAAALIGTPEMIINQIHEYIDIGISRFALIISDPVPDRMSLFANTVMRQLY